ncbi:hypothetical protein AUL39_03285 [Tractidigestivibacter scatoligenes]|uniref:Potassium channel domain-containing protein n=1 Tax=Tractidigestivibacter scatoligenes TaxID=1299998 RepID=A0A100YX80_TRASO|nr:potassium channel family protein [Tractidigestivibacter scatoligenes]KUH59356.1 hypothetical protein AUL39_03285 [Tractidigestivibacter scatoligenes]
MYYDTSQDDFVVSDYYRKALGKDASHITETAFKDSDQDGRYRPTLAPFALGAARLDGLNQGTAENDDVLMGGDIYSFSLSAGVSLDTLGSISLTSDQVNSNRYTKGKEQVWIGDALWCCFQAVTTIGYGDITVTSAVGRAIVVALSVVGILFVAVLTAAVVSYCNELMLARRNESLALYLDKLEHLDQLTQGELAELSRKVRRLRSSQE